MIHVGSEAAGLLALLRKGPDYLSAVPLSLLKSRRPSGPAPRSNSGGVLMPETVPLHMPEHHPTCGPPKQGWRTSFACGRYCSCIYISVPFSRMSPPKQDKTKVSTKKKSRLGGPRPGAGRPPIQPGRCAVKIRLDSEVISAVDTVAKQRKLDRSRVIEGALRQWLKEDKTVAAHKERMRV
jgi:hypothetical protein